MSASRLPGVYFEAVAPPVPEVLPRMDIPAFVGFAASGPLDIPVAIEDAVHFHEIFGRDQMLAWDTERGEMAHAQLPPAVRAFFRNGGRRCWVVRVADNDTAKSNRFMIPGLLQASSGPLEGGWLQARSPGSWSDELMVNATLSFTPLAISPMGVSGYTVKLQPGIASPVAAGDLLQLIFEASQITSPALAAPSAVAYVPLENVTTELFSPGPNLRQIQQAILKGKQAFWFRRAMQADFAAFQSSPPLIDSLGVLRLPQPQAAVWLTQPQNFSLAPVFGWGFSTTQNEFVLETVRSATNGIQEGSWLRLEFTSQFLPEGANALLILVESVRGLARELTAAPTASPAGNPETALIAGSSAWWILDEAKAKNHYTWQPKVTALSLELWVRNGAAEISRLCDLGMAPPQPRYLGYLPTDTQLFRQSERPDTPPGIALRNQASFPRFPLAASDDNAEPAVYLPLGVPGFLRDEFYQPIVPVTESALDRDGLAPAKFGGCPFFSADFFLDPDLKHSSVATLLTEAFHKQYQLRLPNESGPAGEPLVKMHSVLPIQEVSLLAVPDATHRGWFPSIHQQADLLAPRLLSISSPDAKGQVIVRWSKVDGAGSYTLEQSDDPQFNTITGEWQEAGEQSHPLPQTNACPVRSYFRVRANGKTGISPWSNTLADELPPQAFEACNPGTLDAPVIAQLADNRGRITLSWSAAGAEIFRLEAAEDAAFEFPELLYEGDRTTFEIWRLPARTSYFRVSAARGLQKSPFSNTAVARGEDNAPQWQMVPSLRSAGGPCEDELLAIHDAMLRMCAARADIFAVMGLPRDYQTDRALDYKNRLVSALAPEETERTLSFGAIYHPWLRVRDGAEDAPAAVRSLAPDGTLCGSIANRTITSGAWFAPANQVLLGVVDVQPRLEERTAQLFFDEQLNLVRQESRGFMCSSSSTLSTVTEVREINVRRLLILLRRLALRDGMGFVFQPNDTSLQHIVRRRFEDILGNLFQLGAFAGDTQDQGFRVVTDSSVNTPEMADQGRFVVELRVAPSSPLEFLTIRLVQTGGEILLTEGL